MADNPEETILEQVVPEAMEGVAEDETLGTIKAEDGDVMTGAEATMADAVDGNYCKT